jgi:hypothetical protein
MRALADAISPKARRGILQDRELGSTQEHWQDLLEICKIISLRKSVTQRGNVSVSKIRTLLVMK